MFFWRRFNVLLEKLGLCLVKELTLSWGNFGFLLEKFSLS